MANLSIIVPVYNVSLYVSECINSIINQTYRDIEIIIVDDGSTDDSPEIVDNIAHSDDRIKVIHQKNMGLPEARNTGIKAATSKYIGFIDSDDIVKPDMYKCMIDNIENNECDLTICNFDRFSKSVSIKGKRYGDQIITYSYQNACDFYSLILDSSCNKIYKLDIIIENNIYFESKKIVPQEDFYFLLKYITHIDKISTINNSFYKYRIRKSSITNSKQPDYFMQSCFNFVDIVKEYHGSYDSKRDMEIFQHYLLIEMMLAVINTTKPNSSKEVEQIVRFFSQHSLFDNAVLFYLNKLKSYQQSFRKLYNMTIFSFYKFKLFNVASKLEHFRLKRLRMNYELDSFYD